MTRLLLTLPEHDDTTFYCTKWSEEILLPAADENQLHTIVLKKERANKKNLESIVAEKKPKLIFFNGHGGSGEIRGHDDEVLIKVGENEHLLTETIVHALSCSSASMLGPKSVEKGATAYAGYENDFFFFSDTNKSARPLQDEIAKPFFDASLTLPQNLINGKTVREAFIKSQQSYDFWILYYRTHGELLESPQNLLALMWDKMSQTFHGDKEATI